MKRRFTLILAASLVASTIIAPAAFAKDKNQTDYWENENHAGYWENDSWTCEKYDTEFGPEWTATGSFKLVILKSSGDNDLFEYVSADDVLAPESRKDISHIIVCGAGGYGGGGQA